ncbi:MAG TPA: guanylate kinase [Saprospirales bacterium]|nr:guanylate kinase [Saprospirales bacterium]
MGARGFKGKMVIFTAPSGAGKTTIVRHLLKRYKNQLGFSTSATTRDRRDHEVDGKDYYFLSLEKFRQKISDGAFVEYEEVYRDQFYGTLKSEIERIWSLGKHIIFDIEVKGATNIKSIYGDECLAVFIKPPSFSILVERLKNRKSETQSSLSKRISRMKKELSYESSFNEVLVNDLLTVACKEAEIMIESFLNVSEEEE